MLLAPRASVAPAQGPGAAPRGRRGAHRHSIRVVVLALLLTPAAGRTQTQGAKSLGGETSSERVSQVEPAIRHVLMLQSLDRGNLSLDHFTGNFRVELDEHSERPVNVLQVVVGPTGFVGAAEQAIVDFIRSTFADRPKPDLIVTTGGPAAIFARKYREQLFPDVPLLLASVDQRFLRDPLGENDTAVAVVNDYPRFLEESLRLMPGTRQVFMVMGSGQLGQSWHRELESQFKRFGDRVTFIWSDDLSLFEILQRCAILPRDAVIFYVTFGTDAAGAAYADERVLADLHAAASVPMFGVQNVLLGHGVVGGPMLSMDALSRTTAEVAVRLLNGESPKTVRLPPQTQGAPVFDWRELQRWGIAESLLPAGSQVLYRRPSLWLEYRTEVLSAAAALVIQSLLIVGLLYQRRARQRAEIESRRSLALAADAGRRQTMSALTSSITHELAQPLSSMIHNARALQMLIGANRATPDVTGEILSDIQTQGVQATQIIDRHRTMLRSHQLEKKPIDLRAVIQESLALVAHDLQARHVDAVVELPAGPCTVNGDQVLLQQVMVNLIVNAMDAMSETPPAGRRLTIRSEVRTAEVRTTVRDTGTGLPAHLDGTLYTPFVTTKAHGLGIGLTIVRTIIDAHDGAIEAYNNPEGGATFTLTLRRGDTAGILPSSLGPA